MESLTTGPELENSQDLLPLPGAVLVHLAEQELTLGGLPCCMQVLVARFN
jgi:hypothetical protein